MQPISVERIKYPDPLALSPLVYYRFFICYSLKRIMDVILASMFLLVFSPIFALIALLIKLDSAGPVVFSQSRVGAKRMRYGGLVYWKRTDFTCHKFRTMVHNADPALHQTYISAFIKNDQTALKEMQGDKINTYKLVGDPRVTQLGMAGFLFNNRKGRNWISYGLRI